MCRDETPTEVAVPRLPASLSIACEMDAEPAVVDFWWTFQAADWPDGRSWDIPANWYTILSNVTDENKLNQLIF